MSLQPSRKDLDFLAETLARDEMPLTARERLAEWVVGGGFVLASAALLATGQAHPFHPVPAVLSLLVLAIASRVRFDVVFGFTVPTQLAFVPLLFATPVAVAPLAVAAALAIARLPEVLQGRTRPSRLVHVLGNSWFAIGPAVVFTATGTAPGEAGPAILVVALCTQFLGDFAASALRDAISTGASVREQLGETWVYGVDAGLTPIALAVGELVESAPLAALAPLPLLGLLAVFARERHQRLEGLLELSNAYQGTALVLGNVIEADDGYTGEHSHSVVELTLDVGVRLGLDPDSMRNLEFAALLHDVGKIAIPKEIINKPGKLAPNEWRIIKTHTLEGQKLLDQVGGFMRKVGLIVRSHHEQWDGGGYPDGLAGDEIPLEARIIACCDSWNAMRTDRPYRRALPHDAAVAELRAGSGSQFDPRIVEALLANVDDRLDGADNSALAGTAPAAA
jgi:HD-GYP domain-containing protein (c-di-GMP phosphodiesterase class II)